MLALESLGLNARQHKCTWDLVVVYSRIRADDLDLDSAPQGSSVSFLRSSGISQVLGVQTSGCGVDSAFLS